MFQISAKMQLISEHDTGYAGIAFDGNYYYLTMKGKKRVARFDKRFRKMKTFSTYKLYTAICYDSKEKCFWAVESGVSSGLSKLNQSFRKIGQMDLSPFCGEFSGVSYCCSDNYLLVSIGGKIIQVDKSCTQDICEVENCHGISITGITCLSPYYLYQFTNIGQCVRIVTSDGSLVEEFPPPEGYTIEQVLYDDRKGEYDYFQILASNENGCPYLLEAKLEKCVLNELCHCNDTIEKDCCCNNTCEKPSCPPLPPSCNSCNEVLESIALVEAAIAHILNAEGEKIQKVVASSCCIEEILEVNREVVRTIIYVTHLEQALYSKLDALRDCYKLLYPHCRNASSDLFPFDEKEAYID